MPERSRAAIWGDRVLVSVWMVIGGAFVVGIGLQIATLLPLPRPQTTWESAPLEIAWQVRQGGPMYADWREGPIHVGVYGPAYYWMIGTLARLANLDRIGMIFLARGLSVAAFALALALLGILAGQKGSRRWAWAIPLVALGSIPVQTVEFIASSRPDTIALLLSLTSILLAMRRGPWSAAGAAAAITLAVFFKPTAVAAPLAITIAMIWEQDRKRLLWLLGGAGVAVGGGLLVLQFATGGLFWLHQQVTLAAPQKWHYTLFVLTKGRPEDQPRFLAAMVAIALLTRFVRPGFKGLPVSLEHSWRWAAAYFLAATAVALITARRQGSNINYLMEPILAAGWVLALWAQSVANAADRPSRLFGRILASVAILNPAVFFIEPHVLSARQIAEVTTLLGPDYANDTHWLADVPKPLLCLDPWLAYRSGVEGYLNDPIAFGSMCVTRPDLDVLTARVRQRHFASIITLGPIDLEPGFIHQDILPRWPVLQTAMEENYVPAGRHGPWYRYAPK